MLDGDAVLACRVFVAAGCSGEQSVWLRVVSRRHGISSALPLGLSEMVWFELLGSRGEDVGDVWEIPRLCDRTCGG